jgi:hypothetical protein
MSRDGAFIGIEDHCGWAVLVAAGADGTLIDRRRVELIDSDLPKLPHHHEAQSLPLDDALALVERVRASASRCALTCLDELAADVSVPISGVALRECPEMPATVAEWIADCRAQCNADSVMHREALAAAAASKQWSVHWYVRKSVFADAGEEAGRHIDDLLRRIGESVGPPWRKDHRTAMAAAILAGAGTTPP